MTDPSPEQVPGVPRDPSGLAVIVEQFEREGFAGHFAAAEGARLVCRACGQEHPAAETEVHALRRTEGASDPADMLAVAALTCPGCGTRGTAVFNYGPEAPLEHSEALAALDDRREGPGITTA
jgi:hypothetical protein